MMTKIGTAIIALFLANTSYANLIFCKKENIKGIEKLQCNNGLIYSPLSQQEQTKQIEKESVGKFSDFLSANNKELIIGEKEYKETKCKVVFFDGEKEIFCNGLIYSRVDTLSAALEESQIFNESTRTSKEQIILTPNTQQYSNSIQK